ncbi:DUF106 domain-containing protein [Candidatus Woesearchaeota archaeon]|nr:DUF106 domain-containing protein [Candidatus Woesearchaeota archaeon]
MVLDTFFAPLLALPHLVTIILIAFSVSLVMTLVYKWMTDQTQMRMLRDELKKYQAQMKTSKDNPEQMLELQKKAMDVNMQYMMKSLKPTLVTMLPVLLIFSWLSAHYAYEPLYPGQQFTILVQAKDGITGNVVLETPSDVIVDGTEKKLDSGRAVWKAQGPEGDYLLKVKAQGKEYEKEVTISPMQQYASPEKKIDDDTLDKIEIQMKELTLLSLFGWELGWLGTYILFSLAFSISLRKILDVQ